MTYYLTKQVKKKGAKFQDDVAALYRLLGAKIIPNIEICQKKVDILARFRLPGSPTGHRVIVECKDEKKAVAQNNTDAKDMDKYFAESKTLANE